MPLIESLLRLISKLPPAAYDLISGIVHAVASSKSNAEAMDKLRRAALAVGYKQGMRTAVDVALRARKAALRR